MSTTPEEQKNIHTDYTESIQEIQKRMAIRAHQHAEQMRKEAAEEDKRRESDPNYAGDGKAGRYGY